MPNWRNAGSSARQISVASGQRVWKRQPAGWIVRTRQVAGDRRGLLAARRIGHGRKQGLRVGMLGTGPELACRGAFDNAPEIHDEHAVGEIANDRKIMRNEEIGKRQLRLHLDQQVEDLRLDRKVEGRDRLVADDELRLQDQRAGDADPLALAAGELVRIAVEASRGRPTWATICRSDRLALRALANAMHRQAAPSGSRGSSAAD